MSDMLSERGRPLKVIDGFKYRWHKQLTNNVQRWACSVKKCKCFLKIDVDGDIIESNTNHTNHEKLDDNVLKEAKS